MFAPPAARARLTTGVFAVDTGTEFAPQELTELVRHLADPATAAAVFLPTRASAACSAIANGTHLELALTAALLEWLTPTSRAASVEVPPCLRRQLMCFRALVLPVASPVLNLGWVALPTLERRGNAVRQLESMVTDFALRLELWQRDEVLRSFGREARNGSNVPVCPVPSEEPLPTA